MEQIISTHPKKDFRIAMSASPDFHIRIPITWNPKRFSLNVHIKVLTFLDFHLGKFLSILISNPRI